SLDPPLEPRAQNGAVADVRANECAHSINAWALPDAARTSPPVPSGPPVVSPLSSHAVSHSTSSSRKHSGLAISFASYSVGAPVPSPPGHWRMSPTVVPHAAAASPTYTHAPVVANPEPVTCRW